jgi:vancomycin resistance protein VanJ
MPRWLGIAALSLSALLCVVVSIAYTVQLDSLAALTILPRWLWLVPGLLLAVLGWISSRKRLVGVVVLLWCLYTAVFVEECASLTRWRRWPSPEWQTAHANGGALRVVSLNCDVGRREAAAEVIAFQPDLVLLQESPGERDVEDLARQTFHANAYHSMEMSVIARGVITATPLPPPWNIHFAQAHIRFASGLEIEIINVRFLYYDIRNDLWSPACWRAQQAARCLQRRQMEWLVRRIESIPRNVPVIVAGDFNAGGRDALFRRLRPRLHDSFRDGGIGWGDTIINEFPFLRIDQIWVSDHFRSASVVVRRTEHSDHRMVICDLVSVRNP